MVYRGAAFPFRAEDLSPENRPGIGDAGDNPVETRGPIKSRQQVALSGLDVDSCRLDCAGVRFAGWSAAGPLVLSPRPQSNVEMSKPAGLRCCKAIS